MIRFCFNFITQFKQYFENKIYHSMMVRKPFFIKLTIHLPPLDAHTNNFL